MGYVRAYEEGDAEALAPRLRVADMQEIQAGYGQEIEVSLREGAERSAPSCTIIGNSGAVAGMFGIVAEGDYGRVWLLGSDELVSGAMRRQFIRETRNHLRVLCRPYKTVGNFIDRRNVVHMRWLRHLDFSFTGRTRLGIEGHPFVEFEQCVCQQHQQVDRPVQPVEQLQEQ